MRDQFLHAGLPVDVGHLGILTLVVAADLQRVDLDGLISFPPVNHVDQHRAFLIGRAPPENRLRQRISRQPQPGRIGQLRTQRILNRLELFLHLLVRSDRGLQHVRDRLTSLDRLRDQQPVRRLELRVGGITLHRWFAARDLSEQPAFDHLVGQVRDLLAIHVKRQLECLSQLVRPAVVRTRTLDAGQVRRVRV